MTAPVARSSLALRRIALFEGLGDACLDRIAAECDWRNMDARKPVFTRASAAGEVFFLVAGSARITTYSAHGREVTFRDYEAGEHFGDLSGESFLALLRREPVVAMRMMGNLTQLVRRLTERVIELSTLGVQTRLHAELLRLAHTAGVSDNTARIDPAPAHAVLAGKISTNREQVTREISALTKRGVLRKDGAHTLVVADVRELEALVAEVRGD